MATPDDFGSQGAPPTHPKLLDWLAVSLIEHDWSLKWLHREMMLSAVYRQSSNLDEAKHRLDQPNKLLGRWGPRRLEAEAIRDSTIEVSGMLNRTMYGDPIALCSAPDGNYLPERFGRIDGKRINGFEFDPPPCEEVSRRIDTGSRSKPPQHLSADPAGGRSGPSGGFRSASDGHQCVRALPLVDGRRGGDHDPQTRGGTMLLGVDRPVHRLTSSLRDMVGAYTPLACVVLITAVCGAGQSPAAPALAISPNGHFFVDRSGEPVFLTGDTAWRIITELSREEIAVYIAKRKAQGFNTILFAALPWQDSENGNSTVYGDDPFHRNGPKFDLSRPNVTPGSRASDSKEYDYWDHVDFFVETAREEGMYLAFLPCWASRWITRGKSFSSDTAYVYGRWLGARYRQYDHILWVLGGDTRPDDNVPIYDAMAEGLADGVNGVDAHDGRADYSTTLMTYHEPKEWTEDPDVFDTSATWFHDSPWLDFNSLQEHPEKALRAIRTDFAREPSRPTWLFEGRYEAYRKDEDTDEWDAWGVRYQAYQSVFSGGFGHVYGHEGVFSFGAPVGHAASVDWKANLDAPGAAQAGYLGRLMSIWTTSQFLNRTPAQGLVEGPAGSSPLSNDPAPGSDRVTATVAEDGSIAMVYFANGRTASVDMSELAGRRLSGLLVQSKNRSVASRREGTPEDEGFPHGRRLR